MDYAALARQWGYTGGQGGLGHTLLGLTEGGGYACAESFINLGNAIKGKYTVSKKRPPGDPVWSGRQKQPGPACGTGAETEGCSAVSEVQGPQARTARVFQVREH